jgi:hypothetical protein
LHESQQLFASCYRFTLPSEEELQRELRRERALIENHAGLVTEGTGYFGRAYRVAPHGKSVKITKSSRRSR